MTTALAERLTQALVQVPERRHIQSFIVICEGAVLLERYFRDRRAADLCNTHSVTKSFVSTLVGVAIDDGALTLKTPIGDILPAASSATMLANARSRFSSS
jgi:CubicO group peptidase (beta-lactamase class C family)